MITILYLRENYILLFFENMVTSVIYFSRGYKEIDQNAVDIMKNESALNKLISVLNS